MMRPGVPTTMSAPLDTSRICCWMGTPALKPILEAMALLLSLDIHHSARHTKLALSLSPDTHHSAPTTKVELQGLPVHIATTTHAALATYQRPYICEASDESHREPILSYSRHL